MRLTQIDSLELRRLVERWEVPAGPHCSNCRHATVGALGGGVTVTCAQGFGKPMDLWDLIRPQRPRQFQPAVRCPEYEDMGEATNLGHEAVVA